MLHLYRGAGGGGPDMRQDDKGLVKSHKETDFHHNIIPRFVNQVIPQEIGEGEW